MIRAFIALELSSAARSCLARILADLERLNLDGKPVDPAAVHLTLKFLGNVQPDRVAPIRQSLEAIAAGSAPFQVTLQGLGAFPGLRRPRVVWFGVDPCPPLRNLQEGVERAAQDLGFEPEGRPFKPHVTLMRLKSAANAAALTDYLHGKAGRVKAVSAVDEFVLFQSVLGPGGAQYRKLATLRLTGWGDR